MDTLDDVPVELELADDGSRELDPAGVQLGKADGLTAGLAQPLQQPPLLEVRRRHRPHCRYGPFGGTIVAEPCRNPQSRRRSTDTTGAP